MFEDSGEARVHDDDDTIPHALRGAARSVVDVDDVEAVLGDTVARPGRGPVARPAPATTPALPPVPPALRPRHRIRVPDGSLLELDRPLRIGRRPRAGRTPAPVPPRMVVVPSPDGGISGSHLELHEEGGVVVATDLRTLNGSEVRVPGSPTRALRRGESLVVTPGTRIDLGEGVVIEVLGPQRAVPQRGAGS